MIDMIAMYRSLSMSFTLSVIYELIRFKLAICDG